MTGELVIADTTIWSNFSHADRPRLVVEIFPNIASPRAVHEELKTGVRLGYISTTDWTWLQTIELTDAERRHADRLTDTLDPGEATCLAVAKAREALLLTDDLAARKRAHSLSIRLGGTLGVLARLVEKAHMPVEDADALLDHMIRAGYRSPIRSLTELL